jgi:hypothetical protein
MGPQEKVKNYLDKYPGATTAQIVKGTKLTIKQVSNVKQRLKNKPRSGVKRNLPETRDTRLLALALIGYGTKINDKFIRDVGEKLL